MKRGDEADSLSVILAFPLVAEFLDELYPVLSAVLFRFGFGCWLLLCFWLQWKDRFHVFEDWRNLRDLFHHFSDR